MPRASSRLYRRTDSPFWWAVWTDSTGTVQKRSTRCRDHAAATMWLATKERERVMLHALSAGTDARKDAFAWARRRWATMNPREKQAAVFARFDGRCVYCETDVTIPASREHQRSPTRGVMDHRVPVTAGGSDGFDNIVLACYACNAKKGETDAKHFARGA
jgi:hypothetical protein